MCLLKDNSQLPIVEAPFWVCFEAQLRSKQLKESPAP
jgi:hypothetical protein